MWRHVQWKVDTNALQAAAAYVSKASLRMKSNIIRNKNSENLKSYVFVQCQEYEMFRVYFRTLE
jgi:hypothetical protein